MFYCGCICDLSVAEPPLCLHIHTDAGVLYWTMSLLLSLDILMFELPEKSKSTSAGGERGVGRIKGRLNPTGDRP